MITTQEDITPSPSISDSARKLSSRRARFCMEYLVDLNGAQAAIRAGYSKRAARQTAQRLLTNADIKAVIHAKSEEIMKKLDLTAERVLNELARIAFLDARKFYNEDGSLKPITELDDDTVAALAGMDIEEAYDNFGKGQAKPTGTIKKVKFWDKVRSLEILCRHFKLLTDRIEITGLDSLAEDIQKARVRAQGIVEHERNESHVN